MRKFPVGFGAVMLALFTVFSLGADPVSDPAFAVQILSFGLAGVLLLVSGVVDAVPVGGRRLRWYVPFGVGLVLVGVSFSVGLLLTPPFEGSLGRAVGWALAIANALVFVSVGADAVRGNTYVNALKPHPDR
ncbi:hypothetical protein [Halalkalicoccus jeotgali]|uniref:Uncharacterized protein n=1 Tax=Halalkalicoccus jeotgali (strain DSM 18796 / CECT 7217 / JCM 14584 / KCTC 4019 / B3) TaxID=795797 RepID=D8J811_HALJB|nr:hypothetical protein [Halalkalicoccus jeotgali]ADJ14124.1 hypothetical protein HacjB3_03665 [Halalkalicoccus jeotgali B3]ELY34694.1 hypothetical protein C497_15628 [Halalkalicoccus jeotgali B3]